MTSLDCIFGLIIIYTLMRVTLLTTLNLVEVKLFFITHILSQYICLCKCFQPFHCQMNFHTYAKTPQGLSTQLARMCFIWCRDRYLVNLATSLLVSSLSKFCFLETISTLSLKVWYIWNREKVVSTMYTINLAKKKSKFNDLSYLCIKMF